MTSCAIVFVNWLQFYYAYVEVWLFVVLKVDVVAVSA